jgi:hypothetical protein
LLAVGSGKTWSGSDKERWRHEPSRDFRAQRRHARIRYFEKGSAHSHPLGAHRPPQRARSYEDARAADEQASEHPEELALFNIGISS